MFFSNFNLFVDYCRQKTVFVPCGVSDLFLIPIVFILITSIYQISLSSTDLIVFLVLCTYNSTWHTFSTDHVDSEIYFEETRHCRTGSVMRERRKRAWVVWRIRIVLRRKEMSRTWVSRKICVKSAFNRPNVRFVERHCLSWFLRQRGLYKFLWKRVIRTRTLLMKLMLS